MRIPGLILIVAGTVAAQQGQLSGPTSGLVFDWTRHTVRPILGIPGASTIGAPVSLGRDLESAAVSPSLDSAIAGGADGSLHFYRMVTGSLSERALEGVSGKLQSVIFSPSGTAAVLSTASGTYVITGLPDAPRVAGSLNPDSTLRRVSSGVPGRPALRRESMAVSDDGNYVLSNRSGSVRVLTIGGENRELTATGANSVVAFAPGSTDAAVADEGAGVVLFRDVAGAAVSKVLAASIPSPSGLAFSVDGRHLYVANGKARSVTVFDLESGVQDTLDCQCLPANLVRMGSLFRLNELNGAQPLWLLDTNRDPRIVFVPAAVD